MMGYGDLPLGFDSAPLVTKMVEDIVTQTETLRKQEDELGGLRGRLVETEARIEPLQSDNIRLTRENVQLHQQVISGTEDALRVDNQHSATASELQAENRRLKLLNQKGSAHVKGLMKKIEQMKDELGQSLAAPTMMKVPEVIESDPRKIRKSARTPSSSRATSVISSVESSFSAPSISFDPNLFNIELENIRHERDLAHGEVDAAISRKGELENLITIRDDEIVKLGAILQRETGKDGFLVSLRHRYDLREAEIVQLRSQVKIVNPIGSPKHKKRFAITPVSYFRLLLDESSSNNGEKKEGFTCDVIQPTLLADSDFSSVRSMAVASEDEGRAHSAGEPAPVETPKKGGNKEKKLEKQLRILQNKNQAVLASKDRELSELTTELQNLARVLSDKEGVVSSLSVDFAYISDSLSTVLAEKDQIAQMLNQRAAEPDEIVVDTADVDRLHSEIASLKSRQDGEIQALDNRIRDLRAERLQQAQQRPECKVCPELNQRLDEANAALGKVTTELEKAVSSNEEMAQHIRNYEGTKSSAAVLDQELQQIRSDLAGRDSQIERLNQLSAAQQSQLSDLERQLREVEERAAELPEGELEMQAAVAQIRSENEEMEQQVKQQGSEIRGFNEKLQQAQKSIRELQIHLQKARDDVENYREDAMFHRAKGEKIAKETAEQSRALIRETTSAIENLESQVHDKTQESELLQKMLSEARRQIAPLTEKAIPTLRSDISRLDKDRERLLRKVKRLAQFSVYVEPTVGRCENADELIATLHQLQGELQVFDV
jgi:chromosome segregation ATPase